MNKILSLLALFFMVQAPLMAQDDRYAMAKTEAFQLEGLLIAKKVSMNEGPVVTSQCGAYQDTIVWNATSLSVIQAIDGLISRYGMGPKVPLNSWFVGEQARWAAHHTDLEEAVLHAYKLQQWRIHRAMHLEMCGTGPQGASTDAELGAAYWLYRAAHNPPAYMRVAGNLMHRLHRRDDDQMATWMCRSNHEEAKAVQCDQVEEEVALMVAKEQAKK